MEFPLLAAAGLAPDPVLRAATVNAAKALGRSDSLGTIEAGKVADLIALKSNPPAHRVRRGETQTCFFRLFVQASWT